MPLVPVYTVTDWVDNVTPVDEAHMDKLDTAVGQHATAINGLDTRLVAEEAMPDVPAVVNGSWIKGVGGVMVWSTITQADVSGLVAALAAKEATANKGVASGYAGLDSGGKVPTAQLPTVIDLRWMGTYAGATAYKEGDVVILNGISYMALRPSTGETPTPWASGGGGAGVGWDSVATTTAQRDTTSTTVVDVPDLTAALLANTTYEIEVVLGVQSSSNTGMRVGLGCTAAGASQEMYWGGFTTANAVSQAQSTSFAQVTQVWNAVVATPLMVWGKGFVHTSAAAGNLTVQQAKVTSGTSSVLIGSLLKVKKVT